MFGVQLKDLVSRKCIKERTEAIDPIRSKNISQVFMTVLLLIAFEWAMEPSPNSFRVM